MTLLLLGGCGAEKEAGPSPSPAVESPAASFSGVVFARRDASSPDTTLIVRDLATGDQRGFRVIPGNDIFVRRSSFDATGNRFVHIEDCELRIATLTGSLFTDSGSWAAPQAFGAGRQCYRDPAFDDTGRIRAVVGVPGASTGRVVSVDPAAPGADPKDEGAYVPREAKRQKIEGQAVREVSVGASGDDTVSVYGVVPGGDDAFHYDCPTAVGADRWLCGGDAKDKLQYYGGVALLTLGSAVTMTKLAPPTTSEVFQLFASPDGRTVAIHDETGWYTTPLDGTGTPVRTQFEDDRQDKPLFWW